MPYAAPDVILDDACANTYGYIYILTSIENKINKYFLDRPFRRLRRLRSVVEYDFKPSAISCIGSLVYVSSTETSQVRVYDEWLNNYDFINITDGRALVNQWVSNLAIDTNLKVFTDGFDSVGLFEKDDQNRTYRFYSKPACIKDIDVFTENRTTSSIYVVDSCKKQVKQFVYSTEHKTVTFKNAYKIKESGTPVSSIRGAFNRLIVLAKHPDQSVYLMFKS